ncbi:hypothetical protein B296_00053470 [Ensete ventricosum]|uniref:Uncharacterized protein n=1 Tax=Ensete ventricosum TaxID=4639 RepID=A0A426XX07_ENSVE|nr:hypothetical protein B296_00053470 [Ensete ventricosum]
MVKREKRPRGRDVMQDLVGREDDEGMVIAAGSNQIGHLDEALEPGVVLDVEAVELDPAIPGVAGLLSLRSRRRIEEVLDLVAVDVDGQNRVRRLRHQLLAEVGSNEPPGPDHADRHRPNRAPVKIQPPSTCHLRIPSTKPSQSARSAPTNRTRSRKNTGRKLRQRAKSVRDQEGNAGAWCTTSASEQRGSEGRKSGGATDLERSARRGGCIGEGRGDASVAYLNTQPSRIRLFGSLSLGLFINDVVYMTN